MTAKCDVQQALERALCRPSDQGQTAAEIAAELGRSVSWVRGRLGVLAVRGRLTVGKREARSIDGKITSIPVYTIKEAAHAKK